MKYFRPILGILIGLIVAYMIFDIPEYFTEDTPIISRRIGNDNHVGMPMFKQFIWLVYICLLSTIPILISLFITDRYHKNIAITIAIVTSLFPLFAHILLQGSWILYLSQIVANYFLAIYIVNKIYPFLSKKIGLLNT